MLERCSALPELLSKPVQKCAGFVHCAPGQTASENSGWFTDDGATDVTFTVCVDVLPLPPGHRRGGRAQLANRAEANDGPATASRAVAAQIANDPDSYTTYLFAAQYYDRNGDPRRVRELLAKARALNPRDPTLDGQAELIGGGGK